MASYYDFDSKLTPSEWASINSSPGKFESTPHYTQAFYTLGLDGGADETDYHGTDIDTRSTDYFILQDGDAERFGMPSETVTVSISEDGQGFAHCQLFTAAEWEVEQQAIENADEDSDEDEDADEDEDEERDKGTRMEVSEYGIKIWISANDTCAWASGHNNGKRWPCSVVSGRNIWAEFDTDGNLTDISHPGIDDIPCHEFNAIISDTLRNLNLDKTNSAYSVLIQAE